MGRVLRPPTPLVLEPGERSLFLAGSIEMGQAIDWQTQFEHAFAPTNITILNPRRLAWDASWPQSADFAPFREQVEWELSALEQATLIVLYLDPHTKAPVSLLELGLFAKSNRLIVCCPKGYYRKGNVDIVCAQYQIPTVFTLPLLLKAAQSRFGIAV